MKNICFLSFLSVFGGEIFNIFEQACFCNVYKYICCGYPLRLFSNEFPQQNFLEKNKVLLMSNHNTFLWRK